MTTTTENYGETYAAALALLDARMQGEFPEGEREKTMADALNNAWSEGLTVEEWADAAARLAGQ